MDVNVNAGAIPSVADKYVCDSQYVSIILCDVNTPILTSGSRDDVLGTNISVSSSSTSFTNSNVPTVPLLFVNTLVRLTSPVAGSRPSISMSAKDWEFCVSVYVGAAS